MPSVWIDTDMGFDDLAAVLTVAASPDWRIEGLSLVAGNAPLPVVEDNALKAASFFGWTFPIHAGAAGPLVGELVTAQSVLGPDAMRSAGRSLPPAQGVSLASREAVAALREHLLAQPLPATLLALGPLTNLALVLRHEPALAARIGTLIWMGGSAGPGNHTAAAEFNAAVDPESVQAVLDAGVTLHMVGLDACRQVKVTASDSRAMRVKAAVDGSAGLAAALDGRFESAGETARLALLADLLEGYVRIADPLGTVPMALYDPVAAVALIEPRAVRFVQAHLVMELQGRHTRGMTVIEWRVPRRAPANAWIATTVDEAAVRARVLGALVGT